MNLDSLSELFIEELKDVYDAEKQLLKEMPKIGRAASSDQLREAFEFHAEQTKGQVNRLEKIFAKLDMKPTGKSCEGMKGILAEAQQLLKEEPKADPSVLDAALIAAAQRVEHYEIASYGTLRTYARTLGAEDAAKLLQETLDEETQTDQKLTMMAEGMINLDAVEADEEMAREVTGELEEEEKEDEGGAVQASSRKKDSSSSDDQDGGSHRTQDHDVIRQWAEERGGKPSTVRSTTDKKGEPGLQRKDFPGYSGGESL